MRPKALLEIGGVSGHPLEGASVKGRTENYLERNTYKLCQLRLISREYEREADVLSASAQWTWANEGGFAMMASDAKGEPEMGSGS